MGPVRTSPRAQRRRGAPRSPGRLRPDEAFCARCGRSIRWTVTKSGKNQPLDYDPHPAGNVRLCGEYRQTRYGVSQASEVVPFLEQLSFDEPLGDRYMPHFATCKHADEFRDERVS